MNNNIVEPQLPSLNPPIPPSSYQRQTGKLLPSHSLDDETMHSNNRFVNIATVMVFWKEKSKTCACEALIFRRMSSYNPSRSCL